MKTKIKIEYFNSSMVRLKGVPLSKYNRPRQAFQFQYGTIKSTSVTNGQIVDNKFQFQYGTIKSHIQSFVVSIFCRISIPVWYD